MSILWSAKEIEVLKQLVEAKISDQDIMKVLPHRSKNSINQKIAQLGLSEVRTPADNINYEAFTRLIKSAGRQKCL